MDHLRICRCCFAVVARAGFVSGVAFTLLLSLSSSVAIAGIVTNERPLLFTFDGADTSVGRFIAPSSIAIDNASGAIYVGDSRAENVLVNGVVCKFNPNGSAANFSARGESCLKGGQESPFTNGLQIAVDNSGGSNQGLIYVSQYASSKLYAFAPSGEEKWIIENPGFQIGDVSVDTSGHPWIIQDFGFFGGQVCEYANNGSPPALIGCSVLTGVTGRIDFDNSGNCYVRRGEGIQRFTGCNLGAASTVLDRAAIDVYANQSPNEGQVGHVFTTAFDRNERQEVTIGATSGQFKLSFGGESTSDIAYNATATTVQDELRALASIGPEGISVSGGPGDESGSSPYNLMFEGAFANSNVEQLGCENGSIPLSGGSGCTVEVVRPGGHGDIQEYDAADTLLGAYATNYIDHGWSIAYSPALDRVYVVVSHEEPRPVVAAFGPAASGTVPDATINPPEEVKASCATFSGAVNPESKAAKWRFEWRMPNQSWAAGGFVPKGGFGTEEGPLPVDSSAHAVSYHTCALRGNTTFQVRLVGINREGNSEDSLRSFSAVEEFKTKTPERPVAVLKSITAKTKDSAHLIGTIDPKEDMTDWLVETQRGCEEAWTIASPPPEVVSFEGMLGPQSVEYDLGGLLPSERYCARIKATNGGGDSYSNVEEFETEAVPPTEAETSFAAPRLDTSAQLNARINPQGAPLIYSFEVSTNGTSWVPLAGCKNAKEEPTAECEDNSEAREQIVVSEVLEDLKPDSTYFYRLSVTKNGAGSTTSTLPGEVRSLTTRTTTEVALPPDALGEAGKRGIELVNSPDKGNQNVIPNALGGSESITSDGEKALWTLTNGSPEGNIASGDIYLAQRTPSGWRSKTLIPPPTQQIGGGAWGYQAGQGTATPDFAKFVFITGPVNVFMEPEAYVRLDTTQHEEVLASPATHATGEISDDGAHVILVNPKTGQLEDIGTPSEPVPLSVMPDGTKSECFERENTFDGGNRGAAISYRPGYRRISANASRVYFEVQPNPPTGDKCEGPFGLYVRNREVSKGNGKTTLIDPGSAGHDVELIRVTPDGKTAFFTTYSHCRKWRQTTPFSCEIEETKDPNSDADVYRWSEAEGKSMCLTCEASQDAAVRAGKPVMVSDDFSHVYFESERQLAAGQGRAGDGNLYTLSDEAIHFVADPNSFAVSGVLAVGHARLSVDGNVLVFNGKESSAASGSRRTLTSDAIANVCPSLDDPGSTSSCYELYRYDDRDESLECISCRRGGETTHSWGSRSGPQRGLQGEFGISADGSTIIFPTAEALVPRDVNRGLDIYEWRNGVQRLISDGVSNFGDDPFSSPKVAGVSEDGRDSFFTIVAPGLTGYEHDRVSNLYDARIGGGFPRPKADAICEVASDSCQGPLQPAPPPNARGSETYAGPGNPEEGKPRCPRGKVRHHGRCIRTHRRRRHHRRAAHRSSRKAK